MTTIHARDTALMAKKDMLSAGCTIQCLVFDGVECNQMYSNIV